MVMSKMPSLLLTLLVITTTTISSTSAQTCLSDTTFSENRMFTSCNSLHRLNSTLHWTYHPSNATVDLAYRAFQSSSGWVAWALNPTSASMVGSQALIAFPSSSSGTVSVYAAPISSYSPSITDSNLTFRVYNKSAEYSNNAFTIYATIALPSNKTQVNQVWQAGTRFSNGVPAGHPVTGDNILSVGSIDFLSGPVA